MIAVRGPRWHIRTAADGDTHWGELDQHDILRAPCGAVFLSTPSLRDQPPGMDHLPDAAQGCKVCLTHQARAAELAS